jgi:hypothetical protein
MAERPEPIGARPEPGVTPRPDESVASKPMPVRALSGAPENTEPDLVEAQVEVAGVIWTVRVMGRSGTPRSRSAPLLLLGFWAKDPSAERPELEAMVIGRLFSDMTPSRFEMALSQGRPPLPDDRPRPFFPDGGGRAGGR